tara:strand:+ start:7493 stop:10945 length:3453 start_codon:yes stop_codon:yes gene_type:complete
MTNSYQFGTTPVFVSEGQTVRFRYKAPSAWDTQISVTVKIGLQTTVWYISTVPQEFAPDPFPFTDLDNAEPDTLYTYGDGNRAGENVVTVAGLTTGTEVNVTLTSSYSNPTVDKLGIRRKRVSQGESAWGPWTARSGIAGWVVENTDQLQIRLKSNPTGGQSHYSNLTLGNRTEKWTINTKVPQPNFPDPFPVFNWLSNQPLSTNIYSNVVQIQGMTDPGLVVTDNGAKIGISSSNNTVTNSDGFAVLDGVTFVDSSTQPTINNGQFIQLMVQSSATANTPISVIYNIGTGASSSIWKVTTGDAPSDTPGSFFFTNELDVIEDTLIESDQKPSGGITGLGTDVSAPVVLVTTTGSAPGVRIKHDGSWSSWGIFPTSVVLGDQIQIRNKSDATFGGVVSTTIKVGSLPIAAWEITTNSGPDTDASFTPPQDKTNCAPGSTVVSSIVTVSGINRPITINATNGAKISVDFGTFVTGPVTFNPATNTSFQLQITTPSTGGTGDIGLGESANTVVTVGTGSTNNPFTWNATNYVTAPPPPDLKGCWYSKKTAFVDISGEIRQNKEDGYAIGTVIPILKDVADYADSDPMKQYGELKGTPGSSTAYASGRRDAKYPGYLDCDGEIYDVADFPDLWNVIGNIYAKPTDNENTFGAWDNTTKTYTGQFRVPDYRNRRMVGPGQVDGNRGSSTILPIQTGLHPTKTFNARESGGIGGYWYVDDVDVTAGDPNPYQQIIGDEGASEGLSSDFFNFGTVRTTTLEDIVVDIDFEVVGSVTATIGPLQEVQVACPSHSHSYISAEVEPGGGDPLIAWDTPALFGYRPYKFTNDQEDANQWIGDKLGRVSWPTEGVGQFAWDNTPIPWPFIPAGETRPRLYFNNPTQVEDFSATTVGGVRDSWLNYLRNYMPNFQTRWDDLVGVDTPDIKKLEDIIKTDLMGDGAIEANAIPKLAATFSAKTWWVNPGDLVADEYFADIAVTNTETIVYSMTSTLTSGTVGTSTAGSLNQTFNATNGKWDIWGAKVLAAIDTRPGTFRVSSYTPPIIHEDAISDQGSTPDTAQASHNHYLTEFPILDKTVDFAYGNVSGPGDKQGLGTGVTETRPITFNQSGVGAVDIRLNPGTFTLNKGVKLPAPNVKFKPNKKVEIVPEFHKVKYIIKAF